VHALRPLIRKAVQRIKGEVKRWEVDRKQYWLIQPWPAAGFDCQADHARNGQAHRKTESPLRAGNADATWALPPVILEILDRTQRSEPSVAERTIWSALKFLSFCRVARRIFTTRRSQSVT
jgi:hypothetical protein